jgi:hypothetical protein
LVALLHAHDPDGHGIKPFGRDHGEKAAQFRDALAGPVDGRQILCVHFHEREIVILPSADDLGSDPLAVDLNLQFLGGPGFARLGQKPAVGADPGAEDQGRGAFRAVGVEIKQVPALLLRTGRFFRIPEEEGGRGGLGRAGLVTLDPALELLLKEFLARAVDARSEKILPQAAQAGRAAGVFLLHQLQQVEEALALEFTLGNALLLEQIPQKLLGFLRVHLGTITARRAWFLQKFAERRWTFLGRGGGRDFRLGGLRGCVLRGRRRAIDLFDRRVGHAGGKQAKQNESFHQI